MIRLEQYIPYTYYTKLPNDPEDIDDLDGSNIVPTSKSKKSLWGLRRLPLSHRLRIIFTLAVLALTILLVILTRNSKNRRPKWTAPINNFDTEPRPAWMFVNSSSSIETPLSIRVAVLSHSDEVERRQLIRDYMFRGVRPSEIQIDYRFLVGMPNGWFGNENRLEVLRQEEQKYGDMVILDFKESKYRLSEKRFYGLKWSSLFSNASYDYFMTLDSDTFVRFGALARRLPSLLEGRNVIPREQPVIIARMSPHSRYWLTSVSDNNKDTTEEDVYLEGPTFLYPIGIGYMLSSSLVQTLLSTQYPLPHHIHYPYDDVMIGSWLASLRKFTDPLSVFTKTPKHFWDDSVRVRPSPLLEAPLETIIVDDLGWHDYPGRAYVDEINGAIGWNSVCVHHIKESEIKMMREMEEFEGEWDNK